MPAKRTLLVADIMSGSLITVSAGDTLRRAATVLSENHMSGAPVLRGNEVVGVVSTSDILDFVAANSAVGVAAPVRPVGWEQERDDESPDDELPDVPDFFRDLMSDPADLDDAFEELAGEGQDILDRHRVEEIMTENLITLPPDAEVSEAARYMLWASVHRVLVLEKNELLGLVSTSDIVRAVAERRIQAGPG